MSLPQIQTALTNTSSFSELNPLVEKFQEDISFWGFRFVYIAGYSGRLHIDQLAQKVDAILRSNIEFDEQERAFGKKIANKIDQLYSLNDNRTKTKNIITRIFLVIRDYWNKNIDGWGYNTQFYWENGNNEFYDWYTQSQYQKLFGKLPALAANSSHRHFSKRWHVQTD